VRALDRSDCQSVARADAPFQLLSKDFEPV